MIKGSVQATWVADCCTRAVARGATVWLVVQLKKTLQSVRFGLHNGVLNQPKQGDLEGSGAIGTALDGGIAQYREESDEGDKLFICSIKARFEN